jgi:rhodanese-related sulfurtransferase
MAAFVSNAAEQMGVEVITGDGIAAFAGEGKATAVVLDSGRQVEGDLFILGIGVTPDLALAREAGLAIGKSGGIEVDEHMRTSDPHIFAAGDAVELVHLVTGKVNRIPLAGPANKQGRVAGANAAGDNLTFPGALGTAIVRLGDTVTAITGLSERAARQAGIDVEVSFTVSGDHADYYPGAQEMVIKIVYEKQTGKLLGAQIVGPAGVDKRIDVFATAILGGLTVEQLVNLDLAYAPPFGSAKDPAIVAGMVAQNSLRSQISLVTPAVLSVMLLSQPDLQLIDVRPSYEANLGGVPGAINIYLDELRGRLAELDVNRPTVVYDQTGAKGYVAARILAGYGFPVQSLSGGFVAWSAYEAAGLV